MSTVKKISILKILNKWAQNHIFIYFANNLEWQIKAEGYHTKHDIKQIDEPDLELIDQQLKNPVSSRSSSSGPVDLKYNEPQAHNPKNVNF